MIHLDSCALFCRRHPRRIRTQTQSEDCLQLLNLYLVLFIFVDLRAGDDAVHYGGQKQKTSVCGCESVGEAFGAMNVVGVDGDRFRIGSGLRFSTFDLFFFCFLAPSYDKTSGVKGFVVAPEWLHF